MKSGGVLLVAGCWFVVIQRLWHSRYGTLNQQPTTSNKLQSFIGNRIVKVEPEPSSLSTAISPPWASTMALAM